MAASTIDITRMDKDGDALPLALLVWLSPAFPVGGFAYSHGLEWAVEAGDVSTAADLKSWLADLLDHGAIRADCVILARAYHADDALMQAELNDLALALAPSEERALETGSQGSAFLDAVAASWPAPAVLRFRDHMGGDAVAYPVAIGVAAAAHGLPLRAAIAAFALAAIGGLVSAVLRLGPIGQTEAQSILASLAPAAEALAATASKADALLGTAVWRSDIAAMRHETQYSRLFRS